MTRRRKVKPVKTAKTLYGAFVQETQELILVIEAASEEEAGPRIEAVLPMFGVIDACGLGFIQVNSCPLGVAHFLDAFFEGTGLGAVRDSVAPSTNTRH
ncbi:hypothetical protein [Polaromonas naphthalenivorans]|uniref:Uncharacterized protein n=1 Tax=Polaromonas naphthalenivorans (strain CJ2) TaxID=365044 RepID=A1VW60_POLNA|nr:hypothetical protein [Polaromonas naphthalenivorans]ABM39888.1 hypothetical protein Pnap_4823 [Polaromonas naphthalenivorans CJ2]